MKRTSLISLSAAFLGLMLIIPAALPAQNFKEDYKKVLNHYSGADKYLVQVSYSLYDGKNLEALKTESGVFKKDGPSIYVSYSQKEVLHNETFSVTADKEHRYLYLTEKANPIARQEKHNSQSPEDMAKMIDSIVPLLEKIEYLGLSADVKTYRLILPKPSGKTIDIAFNVKTNTLKKIILFSGETLKTLEGPSIKPRVELVYGATDFNPLFRKDDFSLGKYVIKKNGKYMPATAYKDYKVIYSKLTK